MKKHTIITRCIHELVCKIDKQPGHKHLYKDFQVLVDTLEKSEELSTEEVSKLDELVETLLLEAKRFYLAYPLWAARCYDCAETLIGFIPHNYAHRAERIKKASEILTIFVTGHMLPVFIHTNSYKKHIESATENNVGILWEMATNCFRFSATGRRPGGYKEESSFHEVMAEGYRLANQYLALSGDYSHFRDWFSYLSPIYIDELAEEFSGHIFKDQDRDETAEFMGRFAEMLGQMLGENQGGRRRRRRNDNRDEKILEFLEDALDKQLSLLWKWLDGDIEGFVNYWGAERIEDLLELVEDDVFFDVLRKLCLLKNNQDVVKVLEFYAEDDELQIKNHALKLLSDYH